MIDMLAATIDLSIVIVNYNTKQLLVKCLTSIFDQPQTLSVEVIVIDNASTDGSSEAVRQRFPQVKLIANVKNVFFSAANNQGIQLAVGKFILVLNPDTEILALTLSQLVDAMRQNDQIGAATTTLIFPDGSLQRTGSHSVTFEYLVFQYTFVGKLFASRTRTLNHWLFYQHWDRQSSKEVGVLPGSAIIASREIWNDIGGFDARMLLYFSDDYFSIKVRETGKQTTYIPTNGIIHHENASTKQNSRRALNIYFRDLLTYINLRFGRPLQLVFALLLMPTWVIQYLKAK